ncbi:MAG: DNA recombination protein RmuC [Bacilli bacterium]
MEILLYILIGLVTILLGLLIVVLLLTLKKKEPVMPELKVDQSETLNQLNFVQNSLSQLKLEMDKAFNERFLAQTEKLSESDQKFLNTMREEFDSKLAKLNKSVEEKLRADNESGQKTFKELGIQIQKIVDANKEVVALGEDVKKLNEVISGGGARKGKFGEFLLESILDEVYAGTTGMFSTQYTLNGVRPDAVIFLPRDKSNLLAIDAKFAYDNFARIYDENNQVVESYKKAFKNDVKAKIDEIKSKYIIKGQTIEYALCFFPSDDIYQFINTDKDFTDIISHARKHNVVLVSPATLQPTLHTLKALMIEYRRSQKLEEINKLLLALAKDFHLLEERYKSFMDTLKALNNKKEPLDTTVDKLVTRFNNIKMNNEETAED